MNVTDTKGMKALDTKRGPCPLCLKQKDVRLFFFQEDSYKGWCCAEHQAGFLEQMKAEKEKQ